MDFIQKYIKIIIPSLSVMTLVALSSGVFFFLENATKNATIEDLTTQREEQEQVISERESYIKDTYGKLNSIQEKVDNISQEMGYINRIKIQTNQKMDVSMQEAERMDDSKEKLIWIDQQIKKNKKKIEDLDSKNKELERELSQAKKQTETLRKEVAQYRNKMKELDQKNNGYIGQIVEMQRAMSNLNNTLERKKQEILALKKEVASLSERNKGLAQLLKSKDRKIIDLEKRKRKLQREIASLTGEKSSLEEDLRRLERELNKVFYAVVTKVDKEWLKKEVLKKEGKWFERDIYYVGKNFLDANYTESTRDLTSLNVEGNVVEQIQLIPMRDSNSYKVEYDAQEETTRILIENPQIFWMIRYVVILVQ